MQTKASNRKLIASIFGIGLVALLVVSLTVGATADRSSADDPQASSTPVKRDSGSSQFSVLEPADSGATSEIPARVASVLAELPATDDGQGKGVVNALGIAPGGSASSQVVLAEVSDRLCAFATGDRYQGAVLGNCFSLTDAEDGKGYLAVLGLAEGSVELIGVAPDGIASVSIDTGADGTVDEKATVSGNVYQADLGKAPTIVTGLTASGDARFQTTLPLSGAG